MLGGEIFSGEEKNEEGQSQQPNHREGPWLGGGRDRKDGVE